MSNTPRMDEETERLIEDAQDRRYGALNALRLRISQLISEARAEGAQESWLRASKIGGPDDR